MNDIILIGPGNVLGNAETGTFDLIGKSPNCDGKFANIGKLLVVNPASEPPTVFNILDPKALATCDVIISATKPNNDDEPFDINALASCMASTLAVPISCKLFIY